jgi:hypothetical protein
MTCGFLCFEEAFIPCLFFYLSDGMKDDDWEWWVGWL